MGRLFRWKLYAGVVGLTHKKLGESMTSESHESLVRG